MQTLLEQAEKHRKPVSTDKLYKITLCYFHPYITSHANLVQAQMIVRKQVSLQPSRIRDQHQTAEKSQTITNRKEDPQQTQRTEEMKTEGGDGR